MESKRGGTARGSARNLPEPELLLPNPDANGKTLVIATGGTICMERATKGGPLSVGAHGFMKRLAESLPAIADPQMPLVDFIEWDPVDSSEMGPRQWSDLANQIAAEYFNYDGFVILMGTDTMAYCASALSFMFQNLGKTIILTGSMLPIKTPQSDAKRNLLVSLKLSINSHVPEVCIFFNSHLLRGNRARKVQSHSFDAFSSPNLPPLATVGVAVVYRNDLILRPPTRKFSVITEMNANVTVLHLSPGFDDSIIEKITPVGQKRTGIILQLYGSGNAPNRKGFIDTLSNLMSRGIEIVVISQCFTGDVQLGLYEGGSVLEKLGVINGGDMTPEAAATKLAWCMQRGFKGSQLKKIMELSLKGERVQRVEIAPIPNLEIAQQSRL